MSTAPKDKNQKKTTSVSNKLGDFFQDRTSFTIIITVFTVLVSCFLIFSLSIMLYEGLFVSNRSSNPHINISEARLIYEEKDADGNVKPLVDQVDTWWFVFLLHMFFFSIALCCFNQFLGLNIMLEWQAMSTSHKP